MVLPYPTLPGDVDRLIADDHAAVLRMIDRLESGTGDVAVLVDQLVAQLSLHAVAEEIVVYPAMADSGDEGLAVEARDEHHAIKEALATLQREKPGEGDFDQALSALIGEVREHVAEEEGVWLGRLRSAVGDDGMARMGEQFVAAKGSAPTRSHPHAPDHPPANRVAAALAGPIDRLRDKATGRVTTLSRDASGLLSPQAQHLVDAWAGLEATPLEILDPASARKQPTLADAAMVVLRDQGATADPEPVGHVSENTLESAAGHVRVRVYRPLGADGTDRLPVIVYAHGGGFVLGDLDHGDATCRSLSNRCAAVVVSVDYRLAPESPFPAAHDDVEAVVRWAHEHAGLVGGDPARVAVVGEGAGAALVAAATTRLHVEGRPAPIAMALLTPIAATAPVGDSGDDAADARPVNRATADLFLHHVSSGVPGALTDPRLDLLSTPEPDLAMWPPTVVVTAGRDPFRSGGELLAERARHAGADVRLVPVPGVPHEFAGFTAVLDAADEAMAEVAEVVAGRFAQSQPR